MVSSGLICKSYGYPMTSWLNSISWQSFDGMYDVTYTTCVLPIGLYRLHRSLKCFLHRPAEAFEVLFWTIFFSGLSPNKRSGCSINCEQNSFLLFDEKRPKRRLTGHRDNRYAFWRIKLYRHVTKVVTLSWHGNGTGLAQVRRVDKATCLKWDDATMSSQTCTTPIHERRWS